MFYNCFSNIFEIQAKKNINNISIPGLKFKLKTHHNIIMYNNCYKNM